MPGSTSGLPQPRQEGSQGVGERHQLVHFVVPVPHTPTVGPGQPDAHIASCRSNPCRPAARQPGHRPPGSRRVLLAVGFPGYPPGWSRPKGRCAEQRSSGTVALRRPRRTRQTSPALKRRCCAAAGTPDTRLAKLSLAPTQTQPTEPRSVARTDLRPFGCPNEVGHAEEGIDLYCTQRPLGFLGLAVRATSLDSGANLAASPA